jgi:hypothetical protein
LPTWRQHSQRSSSRPFETKTLHLNN